MKNEILEVGGRRWLVREAVNEEAALNAIASARCMGSVGQKDLQSEWHDGKIQNERVIADVVQVNSDGTERQPYTEAY